MAISLSSLVTRSDTVAKPPRLLVYGVAGVGKSTFGAGAPSPIFLAIEDGLPPGVDTFPLVTVYQEILDALTMLQEEKHQYKTLVVDSLDWLEPLVWTATCKWNNWKTIEEPGYGKGYAAALDVWRHYVGELNKLREKGMTIIQLAHAHIKRFDSPETEPYDRYEIKLHKGASALLQEHSDAILFANYRVTTIKTDVGFSKKVTRGAGNSDRLLHTAERPAYIAKNRFGKHFKETIDLSWGAFIDAVNKANTPPNE